MPNIFLVSDQHFGHKGVTQFTRNDGSPLRPWNDVEEMDEELVKRHNDVVRPKDKVYFLGDVVINRKALVTVNRLNGNKVLIKGNHDIFKLNDYLNVGFRDIRAYHVMDGMIMSHIPIHENQLQRFGSNIHGHLHSNRVMVLEENKFRNKIVTTEYIDPRYFSVCVEQINYTPMSFEEVKLKIKEQGGKVGFRERV